LAPTDLADQRRWRPLSTGRSVTWHDNRVRGLPLARPRTDLVAVAPHGRARPARLAARVRSVEVGCPPGGGCLRDGRRCGNADVLGRRPPRSRSASSCIETYPTVCSRS